jgi:hypothetical protein
MHVKRQNLEIAKDRQEGPKISRLASVLHKSEA